MSFLFSYFAIGILGIVLFISIDVMGGLDDNFHTRWNGISPLKNFKEFLKEFKNDSSCLVTCSEGLKICGFIILLWPFLILITIIGLYQENKEKQEEEKENNEEV